MNDRAADADRPSAPPPDPSLLAARGEPGVAEARTSDGGGSDGGIKETIESIILAFILAFIFRGFIVEAFVIPTGSMAPTLLGAHMRFTCPDCGYRYDVNYASDSQDPDDITIPSFAMHDEYRGGQRTGRQVPRVLSIFCPNCGYKLPRFDARNPHNDATAPPVRYGDRILVLKYPYLVAEPARWDVVVFKAPSEPNRWDYTQNYIKRLVGKPGEQVLILDGDVYVGTPGQPLHTFSIQNKPRKVQEALWRIVHHNDYLPRGLGEWQQPWKPKSDGRGWKLHGRDFLFENPSGAGTILFDANANPDKRALTDWLAYDVTWNQQNPREPDTYHVRSYEPDAHVGDVKLDFYYKRLAGDGPLRIVLTKLSDEFTATIDAQTARLEKLNRSSGERTVIAEDIELPPVGPGGRHVEFSNVDYHVTLRIDGQDLIQTTPEQYQPDVQLLLEAAQTDRKLPKPQIEIAAERQTARLSHLSLWRDVYYLNRAFGGRDPVLWGGPQNPIALGADEYFVLGDNSPISGDARTWHDEIDLPHENLSVGAGRVPGRFLIGKAFFVYWPAGYRPLDNAPALVPNFGDMRFIH